MPQPETQQSISDAAQEIFELYKLVAEARSKAPQSSHDLSETEFLALDLLAKRGPVTIGEIQKAIGVVPAQMSRIIRALETRDGKSYVECRINAQDRRRVDVLLSDDGRAAYDGYRSNRLASMNQILAILSPDDRVHFMRILREIRTSIEAKLHPS